MTTARIFSLIVLILSCPVLGNGCSNWSKAMEEMRSKAMGHIATVPQPQAIYPLAYATTSTRDLASPEWVKERVKATTGIGTWMDEDTLAGLAGATEIGTAVAFGYLAYVPVAATVGAIAGKNAEKRWQPCLQELSREIREVDPASTLQKKLEEELKKYHGDMFLALSAGGDPFQMAAQRCAKSFLQADIQGIQLKQCLERGSFCLQLSLRARLWKVPEKSLFMDKVLVYTSSASSKLKPSEGMVLGTAPCRRMEDYCGAPGKQLFREDLAKAIANLAKRLYGELGSFPHADIKNKKVKVIIDDAVNSDCSRGGAALLASRLKDELGLLGYDSVEQGEDLRLQVKLTKFSPGNWAKRGFVSVGGAGKAEIYYVAQLLNKSGSLVSQSSGGKTITGFDRGAILKDEKMKEKLIQDSVKEIGNFVQGFR
jgi:hypothetical protein